MHQKHYSISIIHKKPIRLCLSFVLSRFWRQNKIGKMAGWASLTGWASHLLLISLILGHCHLGSAQDGSGDSDSYSSSGPIPTPTPAPCGIAAGTDGCNDGFRQEVRKLSRVGNMSTDLPMILVPVHFPRLSYWCMKAIRHQATISYLSIWLTSHCTVITY